MSYISKSEIEQYLGLQIDATFQTFIDTLIAMAQEYIEEYCGGGIIPKRIFDAADTNSTRYYDGNGMTKLKIDDLRSITSLSVDGVALVENTDYYLYPLNATTDGKPYEWVELIQPETRLNTNSRIAVTSPYVFERGQRNIVITGKFGYSITVPKSVKLAALRLVGTVIMENIGDNDLRVVASESLGDYNVSYQDMKTVASQSKVNEILDPLVRKSNNAKSGVIVAR